MPSREPLHCGRGARDVMQIIPSEWIREKTTTVETDHDWASRRTKHNWWCPPSAEWPSENGIHFLPRSKTVASYSIFVRIRRVGRNAQRMKDILSSEMECRCAPSSGWAGNRIVRRESEAGLM